MQLLPSKTASAAGATNTLGAVPPLSSCHGVGLHRGARNVSVLRALTERGGPHASGRVAHGRRGRIRRSTKLPRHADVNLFMANDCMYSPNLTDVLQRSVFFFCKAMDGGLLGVQREENEVWGRSSGKNAFLSMQAMRFCKALVQMPGGSMRGVLCSVVLERLLLLWTAV